MAHRIRELAAVEADTDRIDDAADQKGHDRAANTGMKPGEAVDRVEQQKLKRQAVDLPRDLVVAGNTFEDPYDAVRQKAVAVRDRSRISRQNIPLQPFLPFERF